MIRIPWWLTQLAGVVAILLSLPAAGVLGVVLAVAGNALVVIGLVKLRRDARRETREGGRR